MKIANPLYDHAFKYLMSNDKLARKVLSTILEQEVVELDLAQQEIVVSDEDRHFTLFRLDFKAVILDASGKREKVLIELQKSKLPTNLLRFRHYLGNVYSQKRQNKTEDTILLPIIAIYILGYNVKDIPVMAALVDRKVIDVATKKELKVDSEFIELLTHKTYAIQVRRLPEKRKTQLEKFMTLFNQAWVSDKNYILDLEEVPEEFKDVAKYLHKPLTDKSLLKKLAAEEEMEDYFAEQEVKLKKAFQLAEEERRQKEEERRQKEEERRQKEEERKQKEEERRQKEEERRQKEEERKQKEEERKQKEEALVKLARTMKKYGEPLEAIMKETGLSANVIEQL